MSKTKQQKRRTYHQIYWDAWERLVQSGMSDKAEQYAAECVAMEAVRRHKAKHNGKVSMP